MFFFVITSLTFMICCWSEGSGENVWPVLKSSQAVSRIPTTVSDTTIEVGSIFQGVYKRNLFFYDNNESDPNNQTFIFLS